MLPFYRSIWERKKICLFEKTSECGHIPFFGFVTWFRGVQKKCYMVHQERKKKASGQDFKQPKKNRTMYRYLSISYLNKVNKTKHINRFFRTISLFRTLLTSYKNSGVNWISPFHFHWSFVKYLPSTKVMFYQGPNPFPGFRRRHFASRNFCWIFPWVKISRTSYYIDSSFSMQAFAFWAQFLFTCIPFNSSLDWRALRLLFLWLFFKSIVIFSLLTRYWSRSRRRDSMIDCFGIWVRTNNRWCADMDIL